MPWLMTNNGVVYDLIQSLTLNGPAWPWINAFQRYHDGCRAGEWLLAYYEGDAMQTHSKQECYDVQRLCIKVTRGILTLDCIWPFISRHIKILYIWENLFPKIKRLEIFYKVQWIINAIISS
jgi:hypothetical protein